jgi:hypothetical protein
MEDKKQKEITNEEDKELDLEELDKVTGGSIGFAKKKKTEDITDDVADRF